MDSDNPPKNTTDELYKAIGKLVHDNNIDVISALQLDACNGVLDGFTVRPKRLSEIATQLLNLSQMIREKELN